MLLILGSLGWRNGKRTADGNAVAAQIFLDLRSVIVGSIPARRLTDCQKGWRLVDGFLGSLGESCEASCAPDGGIFDEAAFLLAA